jgi:NlpC/P60 family putative phage cell wall peptidase
MCEFSSIGPALKFPLPLAGEGQGEGFLQLAGGPHLNPLPQAGEEIPGACIFPERAHIVAVARTWLGTPYHTGGRVKGAGVDCLTLLAEVYAEVGVTPRIAVPYYPYDWHLHRGEERYLNGVLRYAHEIEMLPQPGDIVLWKFGRCFSHGAIVIEWPMIIHAYVGRACTLENADAAQWLSHMGEGGHGSAKPRPRRFFSVF